MKYCVKPENNLDKNCQKAYALIFRQCTEYICSKLEAHKYYHSISEEYDVFLLVSVIKGLTFKFDRHKHLPHTLHNSKGDFYQYFQMGQTMNLQYLDTFKNQVSVI